MSRTRATTLTLANWKGVFYERYTLDAHVTALEGENGAGKTTVMIAAYLALLPDLSRVRFTNLGETAKAGADRGIWGRLGEHGRPSYVALDYALGEGGRLIGCVMLERRAEPTLELTPIVIEGLPPQISLRELLLGVDGEHERIATLTEVRAAAAEYGASVHVCASAKDYFGMLFERGVLPLRLATDEERSRMHDMLRTSMTGGISRALTTELRSFLLKEESGLGDAVLRVRANLDACRRTRSEVAEARALEREISSVFEAGQRMFAAAVIDARTTAQAAEAALTQSTNTAQTAMDTLTALSARAESTSQVQAKRAAEIEAVRRALDLAEVEAKCVQDAQDWQTRLNAAQEELTTAADAARVCAEVREQAASARAQAMARTLRAREAHVRAAEGLGARQTGLDELHRRAQAYRQCLDAQAKVRAFVPTFADPSQALHETLRRELAEVDHARAEHERAVGLAIAREVARVQATATLVRLRTALGPTREDVDITQARTVLDELRALEVTAAQLEGRQRELERASQAHAELEAVRVIARDLELEPHEPAIVDAATLDAALAACVATAQQIEHARLEHLRVYTTCTQICADAEPEIARLRAACTEWEPLEAAYRRLCEDAEAPTLANVLTRQVELASAFEQTRTELAELQRAHVALNDEITSLQAAQGVDPGLRALAELLGGELLASRFEQIEPEDARWVEAALGPLTQALVVEDPELAAEKLAQLEEVPETVWLIASRQLAEIEARARGVAREAQTVDLVVPEGLALRVTRLRSHARIGHSARKERIGSLSAQASGLEAREHALRESMAPLEARLRDVQLLVQNAGILAGGSPRVLLDTLVVRVADAERRRDESAAARLANDAAYEHNERRRLHLQALAPYASRLAEPSAERLHRAHLEVQEAERAAAILRTTADDAEWLGAHLDLFAPATEPTTPVNLAALEARRDRLAETLRALEVLLNRPEALQWSDAEAALATHTDIDATLRAQHESARAELLAAEEEATQTTATWEQATERWQSAEGVRIAAATQVAEIEQRLAALPQTAPRDEVQTRLALARTRLSELEPLQQRDTTELALLREQIAHARATLEAAQRAHEQQHASTQPCREVWQELQHEASAVGLLDAALGYAARHPGLQLAAERAIVLDRLTRAKGAGDLEHEARTVFDSAHDARALLAIWQRIRSWSLRRLPAQLATSTDPAAALDKLRADLAELEARIAVHEEQLRGTSEDIARGIDVHLRKTAARVRRLNRDLQSVRFGNVTAIRVQVRRIERMELVLRALRGGEVQELLFQAHLPFEEALGEVFARYGGGTRSGASKLLDYREYLTLEVEIQRANAEGWESASPTRLSTGEAIGVGAALMMVILTEWERDANLLRSDRRLETLRFLFLDEANRLSPDNLAVLFELCRVLDLQLLIAAPEVALASGNTTYRLVRRTDAEGREEVIVSGRRAAAS